MATQWQLRCLVKRGNRAEEYEDASANDAAKGRFAVADGASESSFALQWAQLLVQGFLKAGTGPWKNEDWLDPLRQSWLAQVSALPLPWYAESKREMGAFATFLGLVLNPEWPGRSGRWHALAVGDCCLFRIRDNELRRPFPIERSADFGNHPALLCSRAVTRSLKPHLARGTVQASDSLFLATDAMAQWFLHQHEQGHKPWLFLKDLLSEKSTPQAFATWVEDRRDRGEMRNDDTTLLWITF